MRCADLNELKTAASAEIPADTSTVLWVSIRFDQAFEAVMVGVTTVLYLPYPEVPTLVDNTLSTYCKSLCVESCWFPYEIPQHLAVPLPSPGRLPFNLIYTTATGIHPKSSLLVAVIFLLRQLLLLSHRPNSLFVPSGSGSHSRCLTYPKSTFLSSHSTCFEGKIIPIASMS